MSFFDEDDEPRTRVRARRGTLGARAAGGPGGPRPGVPDRQTVRLRQALLLAALLLLLVLLVFVVNGCRRSARESALKQYSTDVAAVVSDSDRQVGEPFFELMRNPTEGDLSSQVNSFKVQADEQYSQAQRIDTPDEMVPAQRSLLETMELRRDGLQSVADRVRTALSGDAEAADGAIEQIAGAMQLFLASDVVYRSRVVPLVANELREADVSSQRLPDARFLPGVEWLDAGTVGDALGQQVSSGGSGGGSRKPAPGLHGTGVDGVTVGDQTLQPGTANRITYGPDTEFTVNFTNQGENDEVDLTVVLRIEGGPKPIRVEKKVASVPAGASASATLGLDERPPLDTPVTITVQVKPVPGEEKTDNNTQEYDAAFLQQ